VPSRLFHGASPRRGRPSQGLRTSRSAPADVVASSVPPLPPRRFDDREVFRQPALPSGPKTRRRLPQAWPPSQGSGCDALPGPAGPGRPSWGFTPLQRRQPEGAVSRGLASPATLRPRGFPPPRRLAPPPASRAHDARCRSWGSAPGVLSDGSGRDVSPRPLRPLGPGASSPRTLRNTRSAAPGPPRHLSLSALVPWPWSQDTRAPLRST
jgi:hypothetical protein